MSKINKNEDGLYGSGGAGSATPIGGGFVGTGVGGSGGGGGVGIGVDPNRRIDHLMQYFVQSTRRIDDRISALEMARDEKSEPEALPIGHSLSKEQISDKLIFNKQRDIQELKQLAAEKQKALEYAWQERDRFRQQVLTKQLEIDELRKENEKLQPTNKYYIDCLEQNARELTEANAYLESLVEKLQIENGDLRWRFDNPNMVEKQTARKCLNIVLRIKNDPWTNLADGKNREWMVAICEDIEKEIEKEFDLS